MDAEEKKMLIENTIATKEVLVLLKGHNGGGLIKAEERNSTDIQEIKENMMTKEDCRFVQVNHNSKHPHPQVETQAKHGTWQVLKMRAIEATIMGTLVGAIVALVRLWRG